MGTVTIIEDPTMSSNVDSLCTIDNEGNKTVVINTRQPCPRGKHEWKLEPFIPRWGWSHEVCQKCRGFRSGNDPDAELAQDRHPIRAEDYSEGVGDDLTKT